MPAAGSGLRYGSSVGLRQPLRFEVLGPLRVVSDSDEVPISGPKRRALLTRLLLDANRPVAAATLAEDLWDGAPPPGAAATLQSHVSHLRRAVGDQLRTVANGYLIEVPPDGLDSDVFEAEVARAHRVLASEPAVAVEILDRAQRRWRGSPLADAAGASWARPEITRLEDLRLEAVECDLEARLALGDHAGVAARAEAAVDRDPLRERLWALLITARYRAGRQADALRASGRLRELLRDELGIDPSPELQELERKVLAQDPTLSPPGRSSAHVRSNLPAVTTELIGRDEVLAGVTAEVRRHRLVTLAGVGGVGKTRLAIAAGAALAGEFFDGACFVDLAVVGAGGDVAGAVAAALGPPATAGGDRLASLRHHLADRRLVVILDNCEHVLPGAAAVAEALVSATADVHVLATSREPMGVAGEVVRRIGPLRVPDEDLDASAASEVPSVQLFLDRARAAAETFSLAEANVAAVGTICRRLDGIPLAIELAAARVGVMPVEQIARRLDDRFRLLQAARRTPERHRTIFAAVAWSHDLLSDAERAVFAQLSVFPAPFDLRAAAAVAVVDGLTTEGTAEVVVTLADRSLLSYDPVSGSYRMLETLRQFGASRLAEAGSAEASLDRYAEHYVALVEELGPGLVDQRHDEAIRSLSREMDNIRASVDALARAGRWHDVGRLALAGWHFLTPAAPAEAAAWLETSMEHGGFPDPQQEADAWAAMAMMAGNLAAFGDATRHAERSLAVAHRHGLPDPGWALFALAWSSGFGQNWTSALRHARAAADRGAVDGDDFLRAIALGEAALALVRSGRAGEAHPAVSEALETAVRIRNGTALTGALSCICSAYLLDPDTPDVERALVLLDRYADAMPLPPQGLNRAWLLIHRTIAEAHRLPRVAIRYGIEAVRSADRVSSYGTAAACEALSLACAADGQVAPARALMAYRRAQGMPDLYPSPETPLDRHIPRMDPSEGDGESAAPQSRRELMALLDVISIG